MTVRDGAILDGFGLAKLASLLCWDWVDEAEKLMLGLSVAQNF